MSTPAITPAADHEKLDAAHIEVYDVQRKEEDAGRADEAMIDGDIHLLTHNGEVRLIPVPRLVHHV
jgi:hypothetical protein